MAMGICLRCDHCNHEILAWTDGNPYYIDETGAKQYAYHPDHEWLALCTGNDSDYVCLACGGTFKADSKRRRYTCPSCRSAEVVTTFGLEGRQCPYCKTGTFHEDPRGHAVS